MGWGAALVAFGTAGTAARAKVGEAHARSGRLLFSFRQSHELFFGWFNSAPESDGMAFTAGWMVEFVFLDFPNVSFLVLHFCEFQKRIFAAQKEWPSQK